jgi:ferritin-like metal-binding protein YciE
MENLESLFQNTIKDAYNSEQQIARALPKMKEAAQNPQLQRAIQTHLEQTEEQVRRLSTVAAMLGFDPNGVVCQATVGIVKEAEEHLAEYGGTEAGDAAIIASAQKVEHYEIANYGTLVTWAKLLDKSEVADILAQTLNEEEETDKLLTQIAHSANRAAEGQEPQFNPASAQRTSQGGAELI